MRQHLRTTFGDVLDALQHHAERDPNKIALTFVVDDGRSDVDISFGALLERTIRIGSYLSRSTAPGERVLLMMPPSLDFAPVFWGALWAGLVPCFAYPPASRPAASSLATVLREAQVTLVVTSEKIARDVAGAPYWSELGLPRPVAWEASADGVEKRKPRHTRLAFLQYTSGSTSSPKGVPASRDGLARHCEQVRTTFGYDPQTVSVCAFTVNHSYGLFTGVVCPTYVGHTSVQISPQRFLERPALWLETIDRFRATVSSAPNFAYDLLCRSISSLDPSEAKFDLSCWRLAGMGGDVTRPRTLQRIAETLAPFGLSPAALKPAYGLSEATMYVSGGAADEPARVVHLDWPAFQRGRVEVVASDAPNARAVVGVGPVIPGCEVVLVDPATSRPAEPGRVGEIWVRGPGVVDCYWARPEESEAAFNAKLESTGPSYLRTGDLGFLHNGELFVAGRRKELLLIGDLQLFPSDIEATVRECGPEAANAALAAFACEESGSVRLGLAIELDPVLAPLATRIFAAIARDHHVECDILVFAPAGSLPRNPLGKVMRLGVANLASSSRLPGLTIRRSAAR